MKSRIYGVVAFAVLSACCLWAGPVWWTTRSVLSSDPADDYAAANIGQLKYVATKAAEELGSTLAAGEETKFKKLITSWSQPPALGTTRDDYTVLTQGQLKSVAGIFYEHLASRGYYGPPLKPNEQYPWTNRKLDDDDYAVVNLGQLKYVFSFSCSNVVPANFPADSDSDGIPDWWEIEHNLNPFDATDASAVNGGHTHLEMYQQSLTTGGDPREANPLGLVTYTP